MGSTTEMDEGDCVVPRDSVNTFVEYVHQVREDMGIRIKSFGHAGDGNLHIYILRDDMTPEEWKRNLDEAMDRMYRKARELNGLVSGEHGVGFAKMSYMGENYAPEKIDLMRGIKNAFDPKGILNPSKLF